LRALRRNLKAEKAYEEERAKHVPVDKEQQARRDAAIEFAIAEAEAQKRAFIDKLRASGDFRQMRIHEEDFFRIRERVTKFLASLKSPEAYNKCRTDWMMSAEGQKLGQRYADGMTGKSGDALQKHVETVGQEMEKAIEKSCGPDPGQYNQGWASQQTRDAIGKASDEFAEDDYAYGTWKEWVLEFCSYIAELKKQPDAAQKIAKIKDEGLRIPGSGTGIYYVYTASEANALLEQCETLVPLIQATL